jgi:hypothetical protein
MLRRSLLLAVIVTLLPALALAAAGTATITETNFGMVKKVVWSWTSGTGAEGGTVTSTTTNAYDGEIISLTTDPGATAPTDNYDVEILDAGSEDVLLAAGANRDTANTEHVTSATLGATAPSKLTLSITNAGDAKVGEVVVFIR